MLLQRRLLLRIPDDAQLLQAVNSIQKPPDQSLTLQPPDAPNVVARFTIVGVAPLQPFVPSAINCRSHSTVEIQQALASFAYAVVHDG